MGYGITTDNTDLKGFINKNDILKYVSERDIFELVFNFKPVEFEYVTSPFREDTNPGCWFHIDPQTGKWRFNDFGTSAVIYRIKMQNIDCFDAVSVFYKIPNFYKTLEFIKAKLIDGKNINAEIMHIKPSQKVSRAKQSKFKILISPRTFDLRDKKFWAKYGISKQNLIDDKVFPVQKYKLLNTKKGDFFKRANDLIYCYTDFKDNKKKLYFPFKEGKYRFLTNCRNNDIGGLNSLPLSGKRLFITKSYKDYRVMKNLQTTNIWFQNEGMFPDVIILFNLCNRFDEIIIFFDNDAAGIEAAIKLQELINNIVKNRAKHIYLPIELLQIKIKDPADMYAKKSKQHLVDFLKSRRLL